MAWLGIAIVEIMSCITCNIPTTNPKFCSRSCAAKHNNKTAPKRKPTNNCNSCSVPMPKGRSYCKACYQAKQKDWSKVTYKEVTGIRKYQKNSRIRDLARLLYTKSSKPKSCLICGYDKHYEVCHIRGISSYPETAVISDINNLSNLIALCPNHHWELDYGDLILPL